MVACSLLVKRGAGLQQRTKKGGAITRKKQTNVEGSKFVSPNVLGKVREEKQQTRASRPKSKRRETETERNIMKRVLATVFAMAFVGAWAAVADECGVGVDVNEIDSSNWTVTLAYKVSMKGQSLQRTADIDCGTECGCVFDLGKMQKINDKTYLIMNVDLPVSSVDWFCSTVAIGPNAAGVDLNNVWVWFGDELVDFAAETYSLDSWKLKGFVDEKTVDKKEKQVKSLFALTWFTSYSDSCDGSET